MNTERPDYYKNNGRDLIAHYEEMFDEQMFKGFMIGNIIKYITRYQDKNGMEDLNKAKEYLHRLSEHEEEGQLIRDWLNEDLDDNKNSGRHIDEEGYYRC